MMTPFGVLVASRGSGSRASGDRAPDSSGGLFGLGGQLGPELCDEPPDTFPGAGGLDDLGDRCAIIRAISSSE